MFYRYRRRHGCRDYHEHVVWYVASREAYANLTAADRGPGRRQRSSSRRSAATACRAGCLCPCHNARRCRNGGSAAAAVPETVRQRQPVQAPACRSRSAAHRRHRTDADASRASPGAGHIRPVHSVAGRHVSVQRTRVAASELVVTR